MRVGSYVRVSTPESAKEGYSIGEQTERIENYCKAKGWDLYRTYTDGGFSGANMDRPALQDLLKDVKEGRIDAVLVYRLDRLSRSQRDTLEIIEDVLMPAKVDFISITENLDTSTPFGRVIISILAAFAALERETIKERMALGIEARAKEGYWHGAAYSPIGYDYVDGLLKVIPYEAMMVKEAFEQFAAGRSKHAICEEFSMKGYRHRYGPFLSRSMGKMFRNPIYAGYIEKDGELYEGKQDAIVDMDLFDRVQSILDNRPAFEYSFKSNSFLGGMVYCNRCGAKYCKTLGHKKLDGTKSAFYSCNSRNKKSKFKVVDPNCRNKIWRMEELDSAVFSEITRLGLDQAYVEEAMNAARDDDAPQKIALLEERIADLTERIARLTKLFSVKGLDIEEVRAEMDPLTEERQMLRYELAALKEDSSGTVEDAYEIARTFGDVLENGDEEGIRLVVCELVDSVVVDGDEIEIRWRFA